MSRRPLAAVCAGQRLRREQRHRGRGPPRTGRGPCPVLPRSPSRRGARASRRAGRETERSPCWRYQAPRSPASILETGKGNPTHPCSISISMILKTSSLLWSSIFGAIVIKFIRSKCDCDQIYKIKMYAPYYEITYVGQSSYRSRTQARKSQCHVVTLVLKRNIFSYNQILVGRGIVCQHT